MSSPAPRLAIEKQAGTALRAGPPSREVQEMWFDLARMSWTTLVLVPADEGESAAALAASLAEVGRKLRNGPVTFLVLANAIDYNSAREILAAVATSGRGEGDRTVPPAGKVIAAIRPVVAEPLGLALTEAADAVVLCIHVGHTRLAYAKQTIELIGRDRIAGALLVT